MLDLNSHAQDTINFYNIDYDELVDHPVQAISGEVIRMNSTNPVGPGISIPVYPGDVIDISVDAYYADATGHGTTGIGLAAMTSAVAGAFGGLNGGNEAQQFIYDLFNTNVGTGLLAGASGDDELPSAYLNYFIFDKNFQLIGSKSGYVGMNGNEGVVQTLSATNIQIDEPGYIYIYVSNEGNSSNYVYFDDLSVGHKEGMVNQYNEYYPFGLQTANSWERVWSEPNKALFNGATDLNSLTNNYESQFRPYDPAIGRFTGIDPLASYFTEWNPYQYGFNDPIYYNDPLGAAPEGANNFWTWWNKPIDSGNGNCQVCMASVTMSDRMIRDAQYAYANGGEYRGAASGGLSGQASFSAAILQARIWAAKQAANYNNKKQAEKTRKMFENAFNQLGIQTSVEDGLLTWYAIEGEAWTQRGNDNVYGGILNVLPITINLEGLTDPDPFGNKTITADDITKAATNALKQVNKEYKHEEKACNIGVACALKELTGNTELGGKLATDQIIHMRSSSNWKSMETSAVQAGANAGKIIIGGTTAPSGTSGHVVLIVPGTEVQSGKWGGKVPVAMDTGPSKKWAKKGINYSWGSGSKDSVEFFEYIGN